MSFPPHEVYARCLLGAHLGYPLWTPQLKTQLCESYQLEGLKIGDVGIVSPIDGSFDVLFNITLRRDEQPYPELVREDFTPVTLDPQRDLDTKPNAVTTHGVFSRASVQLMSAQVHNCDQRPSKADYDFSLSMGDGAVLVLPEGAESRDLHNGKTFLGEAIRRGVDWYECATEKAGRLINNDSLYLITGFHKAHSWSLGATDQSYSGIQNPRSLKFKVGEIYNDVTAWAYRWAVVQGFIGRVGPESPYGIPNCITDERRRGVNQTVFVRGFRITINKLLFLKTICVETPQGTFGGLGTYVNNLLWGRPSESTQSSGTHAATDNEVDQDFSMDHSRLYTDTRMTINRVPDTSQTFHPGDLINQHMLKKKPHAKVALTHDSLWIEMLQMGLLEPADFSREKRLEEVLSRNYRIIEEDGAVYLQESSPHKYPGSMSPSSVQTDRIQEPGVSDSDSLGNDFPGSDDAVWKDFPFSSHLLSPSDVASSSYQRSPDAHGSNYAAFRDADSKGYWSSIGQDDIVIAVMGLTGSGMSSFVNTAIGWSEVVVGNDLRSKTQGVQYVRGLHPDGRRNIVLVDTSGFDHTELTDAQVLSSIAHWLAETYRNKIKLSGILYFHRISDVRMNGTPLRNLSVFRDLCGIDNIKNVVLVTTMWDEVEDQSVGSKREEELLSGFWADMIRLGSRTCRFQGTRKSAWEIFNCLDLEASGERRKPLQIQREMIDRGLQFHETTAAKTFISSLTQPAIADRVSCQHQEYSRPPLQTLPALAPTSGTVIPYNTAIGSRASTHDPNSSQLPLVANKINLAPIFASPSQSNVTVLNTDQNIASSMGSLTIRGQTRVPYQTPASPPHPLADEADIEYAQHRYGDKPCFYQCRFDLLGSPCNQWIVGDRTRVLRHLHNYHHLQTGPAAPAFCRWDECMHSRPMKQENLSRHVVMHLGVKWKCPHCKRLFSRDDAVQRHIERMAPGMDAEVVPGRDARAPAEVVVPPDAGAQTEPQSKKFRTSADQSFSNSPVSHYSHQVSMAPGTGTSHAPASQQYNIPISTMQTVSIATQGTERGSKDGGKRKWLAG